MARHLPANVAIECAVTCNSHAWVDIDFYVH